MEGNFSSFTSVLSMFWDSTCSFCAYILLRRKPCTDPGAGGQHQNRWCTISKRDCLPPNTALSAMSKGLYADRRSTTDTCWIYQAAESDLPSTSQAGSTHSITRRNLRWEFLLEMLRRLYKLVEVGNFCFFFFFSGEEREERVLWKTSELSKPLSSDCIQV